MSKKNRRQTPTQPPIDNALQAQLQRGLAFQQQGRLADAERIYGEILQRAPNHFGALNLLGVIACQNRAYERAVQLISKAISINPNVAQAYYNRGIVLQQLKRFEEARVSYDKAIALKPGYAEAYSNRGIALKELKRLKEALASCDKAIALKPNFAEAYYNRGNALQELERPEEALVSYDKAIALSYDKAIALSPDFAEVYFNRGNALKELKRLEEALVSWDKAIALKPDFAEAYSNRGNALQELKRLEEALVSYDKAIALKPDHAQAYSNRGIALQELKRLEEALVSYDKAIALKPDYAEAYSNRGIALKELKRLEEALASCDKAIALKPDYAEAYSNRGVALKELERLEEALASYNKAIAVKPDLADGTSFYIRMNICDWVDIQADIVSLEDAISAGASALGPFALLTFSHSPASQLKVARRFVELRHRKNDRLGAVQKRRTHGRTRIGYFSADFRNHPTSWLMCGVFDRHDKSKFETFAFSFGRSNDSMTSRLRQSFDHFIDVQNMSDENIAVLARENEIDISVDLMGFITDSRPGIFAYRTAPSQVNYLAYPGTMGADYIDYVISDEIIIEKSQQAFYAEKVAYLPNSYQANNYRDSMFSSRKAYTRQELGLPEAGFVLCCFNNNYKITPDVFAIWMQILKQLEGSVLWLLEDNPTAAINLRKEAASRHVDPARLIFAPRMSLPEHLARHRLADLFLDTLPYNAHTTASDALWAGLPVLTRIGETFAGRVAASLLSAIGLPELITTSPEAYEALAIELAANPEKLSSIKNKLAQNRLTAPLFDTERFTRHLEAAYTAMYERYQGDLPPDHIYVPQ
ncbi:MAG TPA: tetratricopeptide repeat protein [Methylovirgula sp.]|nr:tetratricopeptide repeat protein [Methylovirgula sp.]